MGQLNLGVVRVRQRGFTIAAYAALATRSAASARVAASGVQCLLCRYRL